MTTPTATISPALADNIGSRVSDLLSGRITLPGDMALMLRLPITLTAEDAGDSVQITFAPSLEIDRRGLNVWLESILAFPTGRIVAHLRKSVVEFDKEISPATAPRLGLMDVGSSLETVVLAENPIVAAASSANHDPDVVRRTVEAVAREFPPAAHNGRRKSRLQRRADREKAIQAGLVANGVPESYWSYATGLMRLLAWLIPQPYGAIISAIIWAVDAWLNGGVA